MRFIKTLIFVLITFTVYAQDEYGHSDFIDRYTNVQMPPFEFEDIAGNLISSADMTGKKVHINFWSTTCKPCIQEFVELNALKAKYEKEGFVFVSFAPESEKKVQKVLSKNQLDYPVIAEAKAFYKALGINGYPTNFFIDEQGIITKVTEGAIMQAEFIDGKLVTTPDNFDRYDQIMKDM